MKTISVLMFSLCLVASTFAVGCKKADFVDQRPLQRGVVIKTLPDGKLYFVTYVSQEGADLAPCIGAGCTIQGWSAARLQETVHEKTYPVDLNYGDVMASFAKQTEPSTF